ncbi:Na/Pi cotransporter family protein [Hydrogenimonas cancrithermarum]|nr:Na/Pi symporter [Hydrogenimonas cancrithermarum]
MQILIGLLKMGGGLGIFLLGMIIMTDGLKSLAGGMIHALLVRFTKSPLSGAITGALSTAILQSSSATTVAAVGFVAAGLMEFPQALGIVFGANVGTTITGWIVALFGFKLHLSILVMPLILVGTLMNLFGRRKMARAGYAIAGFGLIFVGLVFIQEGMSGFQDILNFTDLPGDSWSGRLKLLGLGILFTLVTQSSSAGVAATLTALYTGLVSFEQAAVLVIGMDVATAVTAVIASIGSSVQARRTGFSHLIYNVFTGLLALLLLTPYIRIANGLAPGFVENDAEIALVAFHTFFNVVGVAAILPFTRHFARLMERLIPERLPVYLRRLDKGLLKQPALALDALKETMADEISQLLHCLKIRLDPRLSPSVRKLSEIDLAIEAMYDYIDDLHLEKQEHPAWISLLELIHTLDHLETLFELCEPDTDFIRSGEYAIDRLREALREKISRIEADIRRHEWADAYRTASEMLEVLTRQVEVLRPEIIAAIAGKTIGTDEGGRHLDQLNWLERIAFHLERMLYHYQKSEGKEKSEKKR